MPVHTTSVSICITNHDYGRFLAGAIDSALAQTYPACEVVVVDDGSTDDSLAVAARYEDRIRLITQANGGQGAAMSSAFDAARGDVILFLDADDELAPDVIARVVEVFDGEPDVVDVQFLAELVDADGAATGQVLPRTAGLLAGGDLLDVVLRHRSYPAQPGSGHAYRRASLQPVFPVPDGEYRIAADGYLAEVVPLLGTLAVVDHVGYRYRLHGSNDSLASPVDAAFFRVRMDRICRTHEHVRRLARNLGIDRGDVSVLEPLDPAFLSYRLASLRLEPAEHPFPGDRALSLGLRGVWAALTHPLLNGRSRAVRTAWFVAVALLPKSAAAEVIARLTPDVPRSTRRHHRPRGVASR